MPVVVPPAPGSALPAVDVPGPGAAIAPGVVPEADKGGGAATADGGAAVGKDGKDGRGGDAGAGSADKAGGTDNCGVGGSGGFSSRARSTSIGSGAGTTATFG